MSASPSPLESARFGLSIWRARCADAAEVERAVAAARAGGGALLVLRFPAGAQDVPRWLAAHARWLLGDTLLHWRTPEGARAAAVEAPAGYTLAQARADDRAELLRLAERVFAGYSGHYLADPRTADPARIAAGYAEWAGQFVPGDARRSARVARGPEGDLAGFLTVELEHGLAQVVLQAVAPEHQRHGLVQWMVASLHAETLARGGSGVASSTQAHNLASQKAWARLGLEPVAAEHTVHVEL